LGYLQQFGGAWLQEPYEQNSDFNSPINAIDAQNATGANNDDNADFDILALCSGLLSASLIASLLVAQRGWVLQNRTYPHLPILDSLSVAEPIEPLIYGMMLIALLGFNFSKRKKMLAGVYVLCASTSIALDQTRLQPWFYLFSMMLVIVASPIQLTERKCQTVLNALRICILGTYLFAGLQKLNVTFSQVVVPSMMPKFITALPSEVCFCIGIPAAIFEAALALLLTFGPTRTTGAYLAIFFHAITLWSITQQGWNAVVWPWNISMMLLVYLLFIRSKQVNLIGLFKPDSLQKALAIVLFLFMPILNFFGYWPNYLSAALYSGNVPLLRVIVDPADEAKLPSAIRQAVDISNVNEPTLIAERWALEELGIPTFPEVSSLEVLGRKLMESGRYNNSKIYIETFPRFFKGENSRRTLFLSATERR
jgi:hypothetical protein